MIIEENIEELNKLNKDELIEECLRRREVCEKLWSGIMVNFGPDGFNKVLNHVKKLPDFPKDQTFIH